MSERQDSDAKARVKDLKPDEILERLVPDPAGVRGPLPRLVGLYLGNSTRPDYWRLYTSHKLDRFLEFRKDDVLDAERPETGRVIVWLKGDAKVERTTTEVLSEAFLRGEIQRQQIPQINGVPDLRKALALASSCVKCDGGGGDGGGTAPPQVTCPTNGCNDSLNKC
jgi:hypothetical protein